MSITNSGNRGARDRGHVLHRARARAAGRRRGPPRLLQAVRADRVRREDRRAAGDAPAAHRRPTRRSGRRTHAVVEGESVGDVQYRNRPGAFPRPRPRAARRRSPSSTAGRCPTASGTVLDPVFSLRRRVRIPRGAHGHASRSGRWRRRRATSMLDLVDRHQDADRLRTRRHAGADPGAVADAVISASIADEAASISAPRRTT